MNNDLKVGQSDLLILTFMPVNPDIKQEFIMIRIQNIDKLDFIRKNLISHVITKKYFVKDKSLMLKIFQKIHTEILQSQHLLSFILL